MTGIDASDLFKLAVDLEKGIAVVEVESKVHVRKTTGDVAGTARQFAPVLTGELRDSITSAVDGLSGTVTAGTDHAEYVEDGTSVMAPQPFMGPALEQHTGTFVAGFEHIGGNIL